HRPPLSTLSPYTTLLRSVTYIASKTINRFTPHLNAGYEIRFGDTELNIFDYRFGTEIAATPKFTITGDVIGAVRPHASNLFRSSDRKSTRLNSSHVAISY